MICSIGQKRDKYVASPHTESPISEIPESSGSINTLFNYRIAFCRSGITVGLMQPFISTERQLIKVRILFTIPSEAIFRG